jgi:3-hydroxyacyl-CoA dehydrogenase/enoyl-CoA hydratase/3-hydroxybutyryl-CoA epimerase
LISSTILIAGGGYVGLYTAQRLQKKYGKQFKVPKLLLDMAEDGDTFYARFAPEGKSEMKKAA